jgi:hypothetical protein
MYPPERGYYSYPKPPMNLYIEVLLLKQDFREATPVSIGPMTDVDVSMTSKQARKKASKHQSIHILLQTSYQSRKLVY